MLFVLLAAGIFWLDYELKEYMDRKLDERSTTEVLGGRLLLRKVYNRGAMLGFGKDHQKALVKGSVLITAGLAAGWAVTLFQKGRTVTKLALTFLLGGALSNVYDRVIRTYVVDYFSFGVKWQRLRRIVFNVSDLFIFAGTALLAVCSLFRRE